MYYLDLDKNAQVRRKMVYNKLYSAIFESL